MVAIIICMHGTLGVEFLNTIKLIIGNQNNIIALNFLSKENINDLLKKYKKSIKKLNINKGIIFFVDILGGSPFNAAIKLMSNKKKIKWDIIYGTNMPMLLEILILRENKKNIIKLIKNALIIGKNNINNINIKIN